MIEKYDPLKGEMLQILNEKGEVKGDLEPKLSKVKKILPLCLSFDHRVVDGAEVARFMNDLINLLENPSLLLIESDTQT